MGPDLDSKERTAGSCDLPQQLQTIDLTLEFHSVEDGLPPADNLPYYGKDYSVECMVIVDGCNLYRHFARYSFRLGLDWVWGNLALGPEPEVYTEEFGGKITHWARVPIVSV